MPAEQNTVSPEVLRRVLRIQALTLIWMSIEALVSLGAAWTARSPALLAFGGDSAVELLSAAVVFRRFYAPSQREHGEEPRAKLQAACCLSWQRLLLPPPCWPSLGMLGLGQVLWE